MFLGHFGLAYAAKRVVPRVSLGSLFFAAQWADLLWPLLLLLGIEHAEVKPGATAVTPLAFTDYPYSHSLLGLCAMGALLGLLHFAFKRSRREAWVLALLVPSHWLLDWFVHAPDLPLYPHASTLHGLGIWRFPFATAAIEFALLGGGAAIYLSATRGYGRRGRWGAWALMVFLALVYLDGLLDPSSPDSIADVAYAAAAMWLLIPWAAWADRRRVARVNDAYRTGF